MSKEVIAEHRLGKTRMFTGKHVLRQSGELITKTLGRIKVAVITDRNVANLHLKSLEEALRATAVQFTVMTLPPGEHTKSFAHLNKMLHKLLEISLRRTDAVLAFGGGVVSDLAGLASSLYMRGCPLVIMPTTLMAQVDAAIGGKNGINTRFGKNLIGTFYPPTLVMADVRLLETLPARQLQNGYAEIVKHAVLQGEKAFRLLEEQSSNPFGQSLASTIVQSQKFKAGVVERDEHDRDSRQSLNLGHTFAHAIEAATGLDGRVLHGEALAVGLVWAFRLAESLGHAKGRNSERVKKLLSTIGLPTEATELPVPPMAGALLAYIRRDKKNSDKGVRLLLPCAMGDVMTIDDVSPETLKTFLGIQCS